MVHVRAPGVFTRYVTLFQTATYGQESADQAMMVRRQIWSATIELAKEHPWAGHGYGGGLFHQVFQKRLNGVYQQLGAPHQAHNVWLQTLFEIGTIGLVLFTAVVVSVMIMLLAALRRDRPWDERVVAAIAVGGLIGIVAHSMTEGLYGSGMFGILLWGLMGAGISVSLVRRKESEAAAAAPDLTGVPATPFPPCHRTEESGIRGA
jgi:O-antigen ligase